MEQQTPKQKIQFKPVHEGMGFHPFADGLPYAPASKTSTGSDSQTKVNLSQGTGAVAAGRPQFANLKNPQYSNPNAPTPSSARTYTTVKTAPAPALVKPVQTPIAAAPQTLPPEPTFIRRRVFAYLLDMTVHAGFWLLTNLAALFIFQFQIDSEIFSENVMQFAAFFVVSQWIFIALQEMLFETTLGKVFFNLEFKRNHRSLLLRSLVFMLGIACLGLGFYFRPQDRFGQIKLRSQG